MLSFLFFLCVFLCILVETPTGKIISLNVRGSDTVGSVKVKIQAEERIPFDNQELIFNEMVLENINTFTNLSIKKGSTLTLRVKAVDRLKIFLITFSGKTITLLLKPTCTITELKTMIEFMEDIPCEEQALIFNETVLGDNGTLFDYRINKNETLKLMRLSTGIMEIDILIFYSGETITLKVKPSDTIYSIKAMIRDETQKPIDEQDLIFNRTVLHNDDTLAGCDIHKESTLTLLWSARVYIMKIFIKTATEKTVTLHVKPSDTIYNLKLKIQDKEGVPPCKQTLIFNKIFLEDSATVADYRIRDGQEVGLVLG
ncbi:putative Ubiquitin-like domain-containing protein [Helianthus annuus]|nr:putative Ubiquitin-like domain-containing protein [Helianthus annuus]